MLSREPDASMEVAGWKWSKIESVATEVRERVGGGNQYPVLSVTKHRGIMPASEYFKKPIHGDDLSSYKIVRSGQLAYATIHLDEGSIGLLRNPDIGAVSPMYTVFRVNDQMDAEYLLWVLKSSKSQLIFRGLGQGTVNRRASIGFAALSQLFILHPPLIEQRKISAIISSVDDNVGKAEQVIEQLINVKKVLARELLSGWTLRPLDEVLAAGPTSGVSPRSRNTPPGVPTFSIAAVRHGIVDIEPNIKYADVEPDAVRGFALCPRDILIVRGNANPDLVGRCGIVWKVPPGCIYPDILMRVRLKPEIDPVLFVESWNSEIVRDQIAAKAKTTSGTLKVNQSDLKSTLLPVPPWDAQQRIAQILQSVNDSRLASLEALTALRNLKTALTTDLLTGKLRVTANEVTS